MKRNQRNFFFMTILGLMLSLFVSSFVWAGSNYVKVQTGTSYSLKSDISSKNKSLLLDVYYGRSANGTKIDVSSATYKNQQKFKFISYGNEGFYYIQDVNSKKVLMVQNSKKASGVNVVLNNKINNSSEQLWRIKSAGNGYYFIQNKMGYYLNVKGASTANGTQVQVSTYKKGKGYKWKLEGYVKNSKTLIVDNISLSDYKIGALYPSSSYYAKVNNKQVYMAATQCMGYAHYVQYKLYGTYSTTKTNVKINAGKLTLEELKEYIMLGGVGTHIRTNGKEHSMVVIDITDKGFTISDANGTAGTNKVGIKYYSWNGYLTSWGKRGIKFISQYY